MPLTDLTTPPAAAAEAAALLDRLDQSFSGGFARLHGEHLDALASLGRAFSGTPLAGALGEALEGISRSEFLDRHFLVLAAARAALQGAQHDALAAQAAGALGRAVAKPEEIPASAVQAVPPQIEVWLESVRHWLMELGLAGFANLDVNTLLPFQATLDQVESEPRLGRHAALLGGFLDELLTVFPARGTPEFPLFRWADLWSRAMVLSARAPAPAHTYTVSGELRILGADLRQHETFATLVAFGSLREKGKPARLVRATISAFKVDVIQGEELGPLLADAGATLLDGLAQSKALQLSDMALTATGDLLWSDKAAKLGAAFDPLAEAAEVLKAAPAARPSLAAADRHPALLEELVYLAGYKVGGKEEALTITVDGATLPLDHDRFPETDDLALIEVKACSEMVALLRFDADRWTLQPLLVGGGAKKKPKFIGASLGGGKGKKSKLGALSTLKERSSKLLRKKS
ncbi:hypothetical protein [Chondromyces apiculatus]|uniref:Uncharacterized protein n=1 Tax=Chondromyces apiculatus DSM 436 TaxID=1192034 RepID=A0A017THN5_9BACT|nr:hypothetical protein [Chondromyces apiculatus]EYF08764.1 Hypothetical protein CAP_2625 [Chondromyces apiculatus DSM 436]